jgi:hypothetical protein
VKILPIKTTVIEDVKAITKKGQYHWNKNFSPIEHGKQHLYKLLQGLGIEVILRSGIETKECRDVMGLKKVRSKSKQVFEAHCVDSWVMAASVSGAKYPTNMVMYYIIPLRFHRRQLHYLQPNRDGIRRLYGGTRSLGLKRGTLVKHKKYGLTYVGGFMNSVGISLHNIKEGIRVCRNAKIEDIKLLTSTTWRTLVIPLRSEDCYSLAR